MMKTLLRLMLLAFRYEARSLVRTPAAMVVVVGGVVLYGVLYNLLYEPNVVHEVPIVVVDESHSNLSRTLTERIDASPSVEVVGVCANLTEGRSMLSTNRAEALVYLPGDMQRQVGRGEGALFVDLSKCSSLLFYEATAGAVLEAMLSFNASVRQEMLWLLPKEVQLAFANRQSIDIVGNALFNPDKGYGDYLLPVVIVVIIAQTLLMAVLIVAGTRRARHTSLLRHYSTSLAGRLAVVVGRTIFHTLLYALLTLFLVGLLPRIFSLPHLASGWSLVALLTPLILSCSLLGQALGRLFGDGEAPLLVVTFFSVGLIFLAGISFPLEQMPLLWRIVHYALPAPAAILAFVELECMGAPLAAIAPQLAALWGQVVLLLLLAVLPRRRFS